MACSRFENNVKYNSIPWLPFNNQIRGIARCIMLDATACRIFFRHFPYEIHGHLRANVRFGLEQWHPRPRSALPRDYCNDGTIRKQTRMI